MQLSVQQFSIEAKNFSLIVIQTIPPDICMLAAIYMAGLLLLLCILRKKSE